MVLACLVKEPGTKTVFLAGCAQSFAIRATDDHVLCASDQPAAFVGKSARSRGRGRSSCGFSTQIRAGFAVLDSSARVLARSPRECPAARILLTRA
jgi:hypothetical protein